MTNPQIERRLAALEESMGTADAPALDITLVFVEPVDGCFGGRIKRVVKWSELTARKGDQP